MALQLTHTRRQLIGSACGLAGLAILGVGRRTQALPGDTDVGEPTPPPHDVTGDGNAHAGSGVVSRGGATAGDRASRLAYTGKLHFPVDTAGGDLVMPNGFGGTSRSRGSGRHNGVDIGNGCAPGRGRPLLACSDALVVAMSRLSTAGNVLILRDGVGTHFRYHHLDGYAEGLTEGSEVRRGDVVGFMGSTGNTSWAHLHFEVWVGGLSPGRGGRAVDPEPWLPLPIVGVTQGSASC